MITPYSGVQRPLAVSLVKFVDRYFIAFCAHVVYFLGPGKKGASVRHVATILSISRAVEVHLATKFSQSSACFGRSYLYRTVIYHPSVPQSR